MADNPYTPPRAQVADVVSNAQEFQPVRIFSVSGRIGRLRYLAYLTGAYLVIAFAGGILAALLVPTGSRAVTLVPLLIYVPLLVFFILVAIQRSHDMNWSGWTSLLTLIPFVGLVWLFVPGTKGENDFGAPPPPNTLGVKILGFILPVIAIIGILAAIALPAYQQYVKRAQAAQQSK
ncbi:MAG TPA: DUF805 domain-containing protein [Steroidobacteraceae bacterium]|nr:DUF805 domain-containing protein [Steroidobacteraceae bacterium]